MDSDGMKIVDFSRCKGCVHFEKDENDDPCYDCLLNPTKYASEIPVSYEKKPKKDKMKTETKGK